MTIRSAVHALQRARPLGRLRDRRVGAPNQPPHDREVDNLDDVGLTHDLVRGRNIPVTISLGKHSNDHMYSFYFRNPSGWIWEYGWGARPATHQSEYYVTDIYGHQFEAGGFDLKPE